MAIIRKKDIKRLGKKELDDKKLDLTMEILKIRSKKGQAVAGSKKIKEIKKTIARINTQLREIK
jgi:ribosomal protein L29